MAPRVLTIDADPEHLKLILRGHLLVTRWMDGPDVTDGSPPASDESRACRATAKRLLAELEQA